MLGLPLNSRSKIPAVAAALAPLVVVQAVRMMAQSGPSHAGAAQVQPSTAGLVTVEAPPPPTPAQLKAMEWIRRLDPAGAIANPFIGPKPAPIVEIAPPQKPEPVQVVDPIPQPEPAPTFVISGLMGTGKGALATINHKVYHVGDEVAHGWTLASVDARNRTALLRHTDGREIEASASGK